VRDGGNQMETQWETRIALAACYRLCALHGWDDLTYTQISAAIPGQPGYLLVKKPGQGFDEVRASSLQTVRQDELPLHGAVHAARPDVACVMHLHNANAIAVGVQEHGLLPLSQHAMQLCGQIAYHDYEGSQFGPQECARLVVRLRARPAMLLRNHGSLVCGRSIGEAFVLMAALDKACAIQLLAQASGARLHTPTAEVCRQAQLELADGNEVQGALEWAALLRKLDAIDASYRS
jgi:ribulose-5-phosphate 4-epimerase/fuculose-1-phosphate aldolase